MAAPTMRGFFRLTVVALAAVVAIPTVAGAQAEDAAPPATRADEQRQKREAKQQEVEAYEPNGLERAMDIAEGRLMPLLNRDGLYWKLGSLTTGSGLAYGGGFRNRRLFDHEGAFSVWAAGSLKRYWAMEGRFELPDIGDGRAMFSAYVRRHGYPQEDFFGLGPLAARADHVTYSLTNGYVGARGGVKPARPMTIGAGVEYLRPRIDIGTNRLVPTIGERFVDGDVPALVGDQNFVRTSVFVDFDYRQPKYARRGGLYYLDFSRYRDATGQYSFRKLEVDLRQYMSMLAERRVLALRLFSSMATPDDGARIPFYLMGSLGGHDTLRGFRDYRFRAPYVLATQVEYRWEIWSGFDAALFYDAGKVALRRQDLNLSHPEDAWGFGFRFNTDQGTIVRIDAAFGSRDGKHLYIVFGDVF